MLNPKIIPLVLPLLLPIATPSHAAMMTAPDLLNACAGGGTAKATCDGYLMAITDIILRRESRGNAKVCVPQTVTIDQVRDAVLNTGQRPRARQAPNALRLVAVAMHVAWPCAGEQDSLGGQGNFRGQGNFGEPGNARRGNSRDNMPDTE
jgi:hypothetical protein